MPFAWFFTETVAFGTAAPLGSLTVPLMVPTPLYCALLPATTSQSKAVALKLRFAAWNWNSVFPSGVDWPFLYLATNPKVALPVRLAFGT